MGRFEQKDKNSEIVVKENVGIVIYGHGLSDVGRRRRSNEDSFVVDHDIGLFAVADGMGGHAAGEIASREALEVVRGFTRREAAKLAVLGDMNASPEGLQDAKRTLEGAIQAATYMIFAMAQEDPEHLGMGTTLSALILGSAYGILGQVGDSRVYRVRDERTSILTDDHTLVAWQLKRGLITPEEAAVSPQRNVITRAIGSREYVQADVAALPVQVGDRFLICSDGLHAYLRDDEVPAIVDLGPEAAAAHFVELANGRGGHDNITAVVVMVEGA